MTLQVAVTATGRMSLPAHIRKRFGLAKGGVVYVEETSDGIVLRTAEQLLAHSRSLAAQYDNVDSGSVDDFLAARVAESGL